MALLPLLLVVLCHSKVQVAYRHGMCGSAAVVLVKQGLLLCPAEWSQAAIAFGGGAGGGEDGDV
jgi:hypothetical protein